MANEFKIRNGIKFSDNTIQTTAANITSFNTRTGAITLTSSDVTNALGYTPAATGGGGGDLDFGTFSSPAGFTLDLGTF